MNIAPDSTLKYQANVSLRSPPVLMESSSIFPFNLYPDSIRVTALEVEILSRPEIGARWVHRVQIADITNVTVTTTIFNATLEITDSTNPRSPLLIKVRHLSSKEAFRLEALIEGMINLKKTHPGLDLLNFEQLKKELLEHNLLFEVDQKNEKTTKLPHYHGDVVRALYIINGVILLIALPFFKNIIPVHYAVSIIGLLLIVLIAGLTNPRSLIVILFDNFLSVAGFILFEILAITYFETDFFYSNTNQLVAMIFFVSIYFSTKTLRGYFTHYTNPA